MELDPTIVVGAEVADFGGAVVEGGGEYAVIEACEAYDSLHDFDPHVVVLTNLELDHIDFHESWDNLLESMIRFVNRAEILIYNASDAGAVQVAKSCGTKTLAFQPEVPIVNEGGSPFRLRQAGDHNLANANAAIAACSCLGLVSHSVKHAICSFGGAERRQMVYHEGAIPGRGGTFALIDDYAHHPTEIAAYLEAIRSEWIERLGGKRLIVVFQPHLYSRTAPMIDEFARALSLADFVVVTDIYPAREKPIPGVSSVRIVEKLSVPSLYVPARQLLPREVAELLQDGDVVVGMGAGNIAEFCPEFLAELRRNEGKPLHVLVAYAGDSAEREVSILSGSAVHKAVQELGYRASLIDLSARLLSNGDLSFLTGSNRPDVVYLALHGPRAEDGAVQGLLEMFHVAYTGSGIQASSIGMDKDATKRVLSADGIPVPDGRVVRAGDDVTDLPCPAVVKPNTQGSTVGLSFVESRTDMLPALKRAWHYDDEVLVEELVVGTEISVPVMGPRTLPPVEIVPASGRYDFSSKYSTGATEEICPARITEEQTQIAQEYALRAHQSLGCRGVTRTDMIVTEDRIVVLEINTLPGMTPTSLVPKAAETVGISFKEVVDWVIKDAIARKK